MVKISEFLDNDLVNYYFFSQVNALHLRMSTHLHRIVQLYRNRKLILNWYWIKFLATHLIMHITYAKD